MARTSGERLRLPCWWRAGVVLALLAVATLGAAHPNLTLALPIRAPASATAGSPVGGVPWALLGLACSVLIVLLARARRRKRRDDEVPHVSEQPRSSLSRVLALVVALLVLACVTVAVWWVFRAGFPATGRPARGGSPRPGFSMPSHYTAASSHIAWYVLLALTGLVATVLCAVAVGRGRHRVARTKPSGASASALSKAVEAGQAALRADDDDRVAVIACYAAMEDALAEHGVGRAASETASDHLQRAAERGVLEFSHIRRLLDLFARARFSEHPIGPADRETARAVLGAFSARLAARR